MIIDRNEKKYTTRVRYELETPRYWFFRATMCCNCVKPISKLIIFAIIDEIREI